MAKAKKLDMWADIIEPKLNLIKAMRRRGLSMEQVCESIGIGRSTLDRQRALHPELEQALYLGKLESVLLVENELYNLAMGIGEDVKVKTTDKILDGKIVTLREETRSSRYPSPAAMLTYLTNRAPDQWKRNPTNEESQDSALSQMAAALLSAAKSISKGEETDE